MNYTHILLRYGELFLKGKNRPFFEKKLKENIVRLTEAKNVRRLPGRMICNYFSHHSSLRRVFGLVSYSPALRVEKDMEKIKHAALTCLQDTQDTFKIVTQRSDKSFPLNSLQINREVGIFIQEKTKLTHTLQPSTTLFIEINHDAAYIYHEAFPCRGGLPTGVEGKVLLLLEDHASLLAGLLFMKRGVSLYPIAFTEKDISLLQQFSPQRLKLQQITDFQDLTTFAQEQKIEILVSSQNILQFKNYNTPLLIMRPLIAFNDEEIRQKLAEYRF